MYKKLFLFSFLSLLYAFGVTSTVLAAYATVPTVFGGGIPTGTTSASGFLELLFNITDWIFVIVLLGSVVMIVLAGWQFISGGGDAQAVSQARNKLLWAAVGIGIATLARGIPTAVRGIIGT